MAKKPMKKAAKSKAMITAKKSPKKPMMKVAAKKATGKTMSTKKTPAKKTAPKKMKLVTKPAPKITASTKIAKPKATKIMSAAVSTKPMAESLMGKTISSFSVFNSKGEELTHESLKGRKAVLYFYPKDDTPGCTIEGKEFSTLATEFDSANTVVFGVSKDSVKSHDKFICKYDFKIDLISDEKEQLCQIFDVIKEKNMYGKKYMGIERSTFVLDENLKVVKEMRKVSPAGHAQEVLEFIKTL